MSTQVRRGHGGRRALLLAAVMTVALPSAARAQDDVDAHMWTQVVATLRPADDWRLHLELQPRWFQNVSAPFQVLARAAVGRRVHERVTVWGGYGYVAKPPGPGILHEHRAWEQVSATLPSAGRWSPSIRARLEQRHHSNWADSSHRLRLMARANRPLTSDRRWGVGAWNELFTTFDRTGGGPPRGFDQNRATAVVTRQLNRQVSLDLGYMWLVQRPAANRLTHAHVALAVVNITP